METRQAIEKVMELSLTKNCGAEESFFTRSDGSNTSMYSVSADGVYSVGHKSFECAIAELEERLPEERAQELSRLKLRVESLEKAVSK
jgi:hypothetical protein